MCMAGLRTVLVGGVTVPLIVMVFALRSAMLTRPLSRPVKIDGSMAARGRGGESVHLSTTKDSTTNQQQQQIVQGSSSANYASIEPQKYEPKGRHISAHTIQSFRLGAKSLRAEFDTRYGGSESAAALHRSSLRTFNDRTSAETAVKFQGQTLDTGRAYTAFRILSAVMNNRSFVAAFAGYSTVVGRGNFFHQSYPLVFRKLLREPMKLLGLPDFEVRNAAIGGIPSFPYGWVRPCASACPHSN